MLLKATFAASSIGLVGGLFPNIAMAGGTIGSGDSSLQFVAAGTSLFDASFGDANLRLDAAGPDVLSKFTWYYRLQNNNVNQLFSAFDTPSTSFIGNTASATWTNAGPGVAGFERFDASLKVYLQDNAAPNTGVIEQRMIVRSNPANTSTRVFNFFFLLNLDLGGTAANDQFVTTNASFVRVRQQKSIGPTDFADIYALSPTSFQYGLGSTLQGLVNGGANNFSQANNSPVTNDGAVGFQWTLTLAPGAERVLSVKVGYNVPACRADINNDGAVTVQDIFDFLAFWFANDGRADFNADRSVTVQDIFDFLSSWFAGC